MLTESTAANLARKAHWADTVQIVDGVPLPSWIDLNVTELCNRSAGSPRACRFCPRIDPEVYPNQGLHMSADLIERIADQLTALNYAGAVVLCGFGEPLLHPEIRTITHLLRNQHVEIVTNGDKLTPLLINDLIDAGADYFVVSLYDGPHQVEIMHERFTAAGAGTHHYTLRDRWYDEGQDFGLKLTNRAGTIDIGNQDPIDKSHPCLYPAYQLTVDWNGDVLLCVQDWNKRLRFGNLANQSLMEVWQGKAFHKRRRALMAGKRTAAPCSSCNADGCLHGKGHAAKW